jgi:DNA polymerase-3 subunit epsilon
MREIVLDTETTGMEPDEGHKIIEIGCVELLNHVPTGRTWQTYINPEREVEAGAAAVHGIKTEFLKDKPTFGEIVGNLMDFIADGKLVIHNAEFDVKFLNSELKPYGFPLIKLNDVTDTLLLARKNTRDNPPIWMLFVVVLALIFPIGLFTEPYLTLNCWHKCIWS